MPENEKDPAHPGRRQSKTTTGDFLPFLCKLISKQNLVTLRRQQLHRPAGSSHNQSLQ